MPFAQELTTLFQRDLARFIQEIELFPDDAGLWRTLPGVTNPVGNLALHIEGNLREFVGRQLGGVAYTRQRPAEFSTTGLTKAELIARLHALSGLLGQVLPTLSEEQLDRIYPEKVLGHEMTTRFFLMHLLGHLNWHRGHANYLRRISNVTSAPANAAS